MRADQIKNATTQQLEDEAERHFERARTAFDDQAIGAPVDARTRHLLEAQFYLGLAERKRAEEAVERDRQRNEEIAERDFRLERRVVWLIGAEIFLSLVGLWMGYQQGKVLDKQTSALTHMDTSTKETADAMKAASTSLQSLADAQAKSLDRLNQMSDTLRESLKTNSTMAGASRKQLDILQQEQAARTAENSKKPNLQLSIGSKPLTPRPFNAIDNPTTPPIRDQTDTSTTLDSGIVNLGAASATKVQFRVVVGATDVSFSAPWNLFKPTEPPDQPFQTWLINIDLIRPRVNVPMTLTFSYPKGHAPFEVVFSVDADGIDTATPLGHIMIMPRTPQN